MQSIIYKYSTYQACVQAARRGQMLSDLAKKQINNTQVFVQFPKDFDLKLFSSCPQNRFGKPTCECHRAIDPKLIVPTYNYDDPTHTLDIIKLIKPNYVVFDKHEFLEIDIEAFKNNVRFVQPIVDISHMKSYLIGKVLQNGNLMTSTTENYSTPFKTITAK